MKGIEGDWATYDCMTRDFSWDACCHPRYGPEGKISCWDNIYTFADCCALGPPDDPEDVIDYRPVWHTLEGGRLLPNVSVEEWAAHIKWDKPIPAEISY